MIKAVLFDLDGTLVNSLEDLADSTNFALKSRGYPVHETESFKYFVGDGMLKLIERALPQEKRNPQECKIVLDIFMKHYKEHYLDKTKAYDGITELIDTLKSEGYKTAIISNKAHEMAVTVAEKIFGDRFEIVFGKKEGYPTKPDAKLTNELICRLGVKNDQCVVVGDSGMDMAVAKNAGAIGIGVLWGFRSEEELLKNGADYIASDTVQLYNIIKGI